MSKSKARRAVHYTFRATPDNHRYLKQFRKPRGLRTRVINKALDAARPKETTNDFKA